MIARSPDAKCPHCGGTKYAMYYRTYGDQQYHGYYSEKCETCSGVGVIAKPAEQDASD